MLCVWVKYVQYTRDMLKVLVHIRYIAGNALQLQEFGNNDSS
jgi:hypothetical protein